LRERIALAEREIETISSHDISHQIGMVALRSELMALLDNSIANASFEGKVELVSRLGIKIEPAEDLKLRRSSAILVRKTWD
jgi:hypothetical protein